MLAKGLEWPSQGVLLELEQLVVVVAVVLVDMQLVLAPTGEGGAGGGGELQDEQVDDVMMDMDGCFVIEVSFLPTGSGLTLATVIPPPPPFGEVVVTDVLLLELVTVATAGEVLSSSAFFLPPPPVTVSFVMDIEGPSFILAGPGESPDDVGRMVKRVEVALRLLRPLED